MKCHKTALYAMYTIIVCMAALSTVATYAGAPDARSETPTDTEALRTGTPFTAQSSLDDYLAYAFDHSPTLQAAEARVGAATERATHTGYLPDPELTYSHMVEQHDMQYSIAIQQQIPVFGTLSLQRKIALLAADAGEHDARALRLMVFEHVIKAFYEYHHLERSIAIIEDNVALLDDIEKVILTRFKSKGATYSDVLKIQVERDRMKNHLESLQDMRPVQSASLAALLGLPTHIILPWPTVIPTEGGNLSADALMDMLELLNPELQAMDTRIESLTSAEKLARRRKLPSFVIGASINQMPRQANGSEPQDYGIMIGVSLPIWWKKYQAQAREAVLTKTAATHTRKQMEIDLEVDLRRALFEWRDAKRKIELLQTSLLPKANQAQEVAMNEFQSGNASFMTLIDAQRTLLNLNLELERALANREIAAGEIGCCVGQYDLKALGIK